ncbi:MAG: tRNA dimethylallyltransferase [Candidatus Magasanikbacteria bacterium GW2011_GWC2_37_14]|uniref:tRNA dimethylallyltransferase n=1 Tax=Candidatus Magasanikbacteria bacterium GW2011_GWC2_37_14 TaxID=1619046 RepID=A0A0G0G7I2_9BACT|nr:MAG: tRNA dimethylallyltransferase [Candidatus Magasanikbacteria bacterium GW2011_GWC2_37_14]
MNKELPKIIVICGPTASGKTGWSLALAKKFNSEIISADSRQIYKEMNIGTAKESGVWQKGAYLINKIPHYLIDTIYPNEIYSAAQFSVEAKNVVKNIYKKKKTPFIVGGTGLYIDVLINNFSIPEVKPNLVLRVSLEEKSLVELQELLKKIDPETYQTIDLKNKRRLSRALEVVITTGESFKNKQQKGKKLFNVLYIGIDLPREILYDRINTRIDEQIKTGLLGEVESLANKYSWESPAMSGIGYRQFKDYFAGLITLDKAKEDLKQATRQYAKRQLTWFKRNQEINWCKSLAEAEKLVQNFLK